MTAPIITTAAALGRMEFPPVRWVVPGLLPAGVTLLASRPKMGKSWLALQLGCAVATGGTALSHAQVPAGDVLYLALEDNSRRLNTRLKQQCNSAAFPERLHLATEWPRAHLGGRAHFETWLDAMPAARLVIVDTLAKLRPQGRGGQSSYDDDYAYLSGYKAIADERDIAVLLVHHTRKSSDNADPFDAVSGTLGLTGAADGTMMLTRKRGEADGVLHVTHRDLEQELELALRFDTATASWSVLGGAHEYAVSRQRLQVLELLRETGDPMTRTDIATALAVPNDDSLRKLLSRMSDDAQLRSGPTSGRANTYQAAAQ